MKTEKMIMSITPIGKDLPEGPDKNIPYRKPQDIR
jgi:hypothetical protein